MGWIRMEGCGRGEVVGGGEEVGVWMRREVR